MTTTGRSPARRSAGLRVDLALYVLYGAFAVILLAGGTGFFTYRVWAGYAVPGYLGAAALTGVLLLRRKDDPRLRGALVAATAVVVLLLPLASLVVSWSAGVAGAVHPEVVAVERGAARLVAGEFPYLSAEELARHGSSTDYTPYLPVMIAFGLPRALIGPAPLTDPRIVFAAVAVALVAAAAALCPSGARSVRWWTIAALSPLTALPFHSGGHDLPVVAATVLGFVLLARRWTVAAAVVMGATMAMKATSAVPLVVAVVLLAATRPTREAVRFGAVAVATFGAVLLPFLVIDADSLVRNVLLHPAGLENARLLATDPFPGVLLAEWGVLGRTGSVVLLGVVALGLLVWLVRRPPRNVGEALERSAVCLTAAVVVAPTSRAGYLLYPLVLLVTARCWAAELGQESSETADLLEGEPRVERR